MKNKQNKTWITNDYYQNIYYNDYYQKSLITTESELPMCGMNDKVWKTIITKENDYYKNII
tara:strand:- start:3466 stop:3648 length:183 start_codon:yes stop_codon:yes gene_type:complete